MSKEGSKEYSELVERKAIDLFWRDWNKNYTTMKFACGNWLEDFDGDNTEYARERYRDEAKQILSDPSILIKADDQIVPLEDDITIRSIQWSDDAVLTYRLAQHDMKVIGWVKTADKGE